MYTPEHRRATKRAQLNDQLLISPNMQQTTLLVYGGWLDGAAMLLYMQALPITASNF